MLKIKTAINNVFAHSMHEADCIDLFVKSSMVYRLIVSRVTSSYLIAYNRNGLNLDFFQDINKHVKRFEEVSWDSVNLDNELDEDLQGIVWSVNGNYGKYLPRYGVPNESLIEHIVKIVEADKNCCMSPTSDGYKKALKALEGFHILRGSVNDMETGFILTDNKEVVSTLLSSNGTKLEEVTIDALRPESIIISVICECRELYPDMLPCKFGYFKFGKLLTEIRKGSGCKCTTEPTVKDFLGNPICVGDTIVALKHMSTSSHLYKGTVKSVSKKLVTIENVENADNTYYLKDEMCVSAEKTVVIK